MYLLSNFNRPGTENIYFIKAEDIRKLKNVHTKNLHPCDERMMRFWAIFRLLFYYPNRQLDTDELLWWCSYRYEKIDLTLSLHHHDHHYQEVVNTSIILFFFYQQRILHSKKIICRINMFLNVFFYPKTLRYHSSHHHIQFLVIASRTHASTNFFNTKI